jgi:hypothetical protein
MPACPACKQLGSYAKIGEAACDSCRVDLYEENRDAGTVYMLCRNQVITAGMGEVIDLNYQTVKTIMDLYGVKDQQDCLMKVINTFHHFLAKERG